MQPYLVSVLAPFLALHLAASRAVGGAAARPPLAVLRPEHNPLARPGGRVPVPTIVWDDIRVRPDHPRLLFTRDTLPALRERFRRHRHREAIARTAQGGGPVACALLYQLTGRRAYAESAVEKLLNGRVHSPAVAYVYDWTYDAMSAAQREEATACLQDLVFVDRSTGWPRPSPYTGFPDDPRPSDVSPDEWLSFYNWTFHDRDWARAYAGLFARMIALAHHAPRMAEGVRNYWEYSLKDPTLFYDHLRDGSSYQGHFWSVTERIEQIVRVFTHVQTATGLDYLDPKAHPYLSNVGRWLLYASAPSEGRVLLNYGVGSMRPIPRSALLASNSLARDPHVAWLLESASPKRCDWLVEFLYDDAKVTPEPPDRLPPARAFPGTGLAIMRSGWSARDPWVAIRFADWWDTHNHPDVGSFIIYCKSPLVPDSGHYCSIGLHRTYSASTIAHNTITVRDPSIKDAYYCGGQRGRDVRVWSFAIGRAAWVYHQDKHERGELLAFQTHPLYDYCAGEGHRAYRPDHVQEFLRQSVFLRDGVFVVFDRVEATRAGLETRWLMHLVGEPRISGSPVHTQVKGHIEDYDGALTVSQGRKRSVLRIHTLLPDQHRIRRVGGAVPNVPASALVRVPPAKHRMGTGSRWSWTDPLFLYYRDPASGRKLAAIAFERNSPTDLDYEISDTHLYMKFAAYERGRVDELRLRLADYPNILQLVRDIAVRKLWHLRVHYLPGYQYYLNGVNYSPHYGVDAWKDIAARAPELLGKPNDYGAWRIEVRPATQSKRTYFLHAIRILPTPEDEPGDVEHRETRDAAEVTIRLKGKTYTITFRKTGKPGGHVRVADGTGAVLVDRPFAQAIRQQPWP